MINPSQVNLLSWGIEMRYWLGKISQSTARRQHDIYCKVAWQSSFFIYFLVILGIRTWDNVFKNGPIEICERQPLKDLK